MTRWGRSSLIINDLLKKGEILNFCDGKEWRWKNDQGETRIGRKWRLITRWVVINHFNFYWPHTAANMGLEMNLYDGNDQFSFLWVNYKKKNYYFCMWDGGRRDEVKREWRRLIIPCLGLRLHWTPTWMIPSPTKGEQLPELLALSEPLL